jgi:hypothetical protein
MKSKHSFEGMSASESSEITSKSIFCHRAFLSHSAFDESDALLNPLFFHPFNSISGR